MGKYTRRRWLLTVGGVAAAGSAGFALHRGVRYPMLQLEPNAVAKHLTNTPVGEIYLRGLFVKQAAGAARVSETGAPPTTHLRAFTPEPAVEIHGPTSPGDFHFRIDNVHPKGVLTLRRSPTEIDVDERIDGLSRRLSMKIGALTEPVEIAYRVPFQEGFRFAAFGDSGGGSELRWCLDRAARSGADFIFHLGDIFYHDSDIELAPTAIDEARVPVFVSIGNHDFNRGLRRLHRDFSSAFGPRNSVFELAGIRIVNIDTAAATQPPSGGERGRLLASVANRHAESDIGNIVVTHKPLFDPRRRIDPNYSHDVPTTEANWLHERLLDLDTHALIAGHIHYKDEIDENGLMTSVSGDGLARRDFLDNFPVSQFLMGDVEPQRKPQFSWKTLDMPLNRHCHPDTIVWLARQGLNEERERLERACLAANARAT